MRIRFPSGLSRVSGPPLTLRPSTIPRITSLGLRCAIAIHRSSLILSDINMPGMSGLELLPKAKALRPDVPVIMITAYGDAETKRKASTGRGTPRHVGNQVKNGPLADIAETTILDHFRRAALDGAAYKAVASVGKLLDPRLAATWQGAVDAADCGLARTARYVGVLGEGRMNVRHEKVRRRCTPAGLLF